MVYALIFINNHVITSINYILLIGGMMNNEKNSHDH